MIKKILLLAGSAEARQIARVLIGAGQEVRVLMSEMPRGSNPMPLPYRVVAPDYPHRLTEDVTWCDAVVDTSHGFDARMTEAAETAAREAGKPIVTLSREKWGLEADNWHHARDVATAMQLIAPKARTFCATGWDSLPQLQHFAGEVLLLRQTTQHDRAAPFEFVELVFGNPPFDVPSERALFERLRVDSLICRNLGGQPSRPKLEAALALQLKVILIDRPPLPSGIDVVPTAKAALDWVAGL